jgi:hypothetical protein
MNATARTSMPRGCPANAARGEAVLMVDGEPQVLCLTLGALATLESAFDAEGAEALAARLRRLTSADLLTVIAALASDRTLTVERLKHARIDPAEAASAVARAFELAFA